MTQSDLVCFSSASEKIAEKVKDEISKIGLLRSRLKTDVPVKELESLSDASSVAKQVETVLDQVKHLRTAVSTTIEKAKTKSFRATGSKLTIYLSFTFNSSSRYLFVIVRCRLRN